MAISKVFVVINSDGIVMGVLDKKSKADTLKKVGKKRWDEEWKITSYSINAVESWILAGDETYRKVKQR